MKTSIFFAWFDLWIGFYWDQKNGIIYFCPLPMLVIKFDFHPLWDEKRSTRILRGWKMPEPPGKICPSCRNELDIPTAIDTGEGWYLSWDCKEGCGETEIQMDTWPFVDDLANGRDFEAAGFEVV